MPAQGYKPGWRRKKPQRFILRGESYSAYTWKDLYIGLLEVLYKKYPTQFRSKILSLNSGTKRIYFSLEKNRIQDEPRQIPGAGIYAETKWNANQIEDRCLEVVKPFGYVRTEFKIIAD